MIYAPDMTTTALRAILGDPASSSWDQREAAAEVARRDLDAERVEDQPIQGPAAFTQKRFQVTLSNGTSVMGRLTRSFTDIQAARGVACEVRPWNNTYAVINDCWADALVPLFGDRCVCCYCFDRHVGRHEHVVAPCAAHPDRFAQPVSPFATRVIPPRPVLAPAALQVPPMSDEEHQELLDDLLGRL